MAHDPIEPDYSDNAVQKACELVGRFMFHWTRLESRINGVIHDLFNLEGASGDILTANIGFRDKLHIIHTTLMYQGLVHDEEWRKCARKLVGRIGRLNRKRNLLAHTPFMPLASKSVRFYKIEAKGDINYSAVHWSPIDFRRTEKLIEKASDDLQELTTQLQSRQAVIKALAAVPTRISNSSVPGLGGLFPPLPVPPDTPG